MVPLFASFEFEFFSFSCSMKPPRKKPTKFLGYVSDFEFLINKRGKFRKIGEVRIGRNKLIFIKLNVLSMYVL